MAGYLGSVPVPQATQHRESFTATEGQTSFATAGYTPQFVDVYLNGSHLSPADFTASNGSDVVLGVAASADDVCDIISYTPFEIADQTFTGTTTTDVSLTTGVLTANGGAVFNEGSVDVDFRVEGNGNANALFVEGATDQVGIGTNDPARPLSVFHATAPYVQVANNTSGIAAGDGFQLQLVAADLYQWNYENGFQRFGSGNAESMNISAVGQITMPRQPAFLAQPASAQSNLAINTDHDIAFATERFDQGNNFATPNFTAPVDGKYQFNIHVFFNELDVDGIFYEIKLITTLRTYKHIIDMRPFDADVPNWSFNASVLANMDATDTAKVVVVPYNSGAAQADVSTSSHFSGYLVA